MILALLACSPPDTARGVLVDALRGAPIAGATVRAEAPGEGCLRVSTVTDDEGTFVIEAPCADSVVVPVDPQWWAPTPAPVAAELRLEVWRAPAAPGLYALRGAELTQLTTNAPVATLALPAGEVRYPLVLPGAPPTLSAADHVVLAGPEVARWSLSPLVPTPALRVEGPDGPSTFGEWVAVGQRVGADGAVTPVETKVEPRDISGGVTGGDPPSQADEHPDHYRYLPLAGLDSGRWFLGEGEASRGVVIDLVDG